MLLKASLVLNDKEDDGKFGQENPIRFVNKIGKHEEQYTELLQH